MMYIPIIFFLSDVTLRVEDEDEEIDQQDELLRENNRSYKGTRKTLLLECRESMTSSQRRATLTNSSRGKCWPQGTWPIKPQLYLQQMVQSKL